MQTGWRAVIQTHSLVLAEFGRNSCWLSCWSTSGRTLLPKWKANVYIIQQLEPDTPNTAELLYFVTKENNTGSVNCTSLGIPFTNTLIYFHQLRMQAPHVSGKTRGQCGQLFLLKLFESRDPPARCNQLWFISIHETYVQFSTKISFKSMNINNETFLRWRLEIAGAERPFEGNQIMSAVNESMGSIENVSNERPARTVALKSLVFNSNFWSTG